MYQMKIDTKTKIHFLWFAFILVVAMVAAVLGAQKPVEAGWPGSDFELTVNVSPGSSGGIKIDQATSTYFPDTSTFRSGAPIRIEVVPASGYRFEHWSGDLTGTTNPASLVIDCDKQITAHFSLVESNSWPIGYIIAGGIAAGVIVLLAVRSRVS